MRARTWTIVAVVLTLALPVVGAAADDQRWLHITVVENGEGTNVELNLPLNLVQTLVEGIDVDGFERGKVELDLDDADIDWPEVLAAVRTAPDGEFVRVDSTDGQVEITKKGGTVHIHAVELGGDNAVADISLPAAMIDAFSVDEEDQIDVAALLRSISDLPSGDLIRVTSDDANVRIWVE